MGSYDNITEKNMEKSDENKETLMCVDSLQYNGHNDKGETNFPYILLNCTESPIVIEDDNVDDSLSDINNSGIIDVRNELKMPIPGLPTTGKKNLTFSKDDFDSDLEIIEPLMLKNITYDTTKNSNIFKRQKKNHSLNLKKLKKASTATVPHNGTISKDCSLVKSNAFLSHRLKSTVQRKQMSSTPRFVQLSSNSESLKQSDSLSLYNTTSENHRSQNFKIIRVKKPSNKYKESLSDKIIDLTAQSDSSDNVAEEKHFIDHTSNPTEKTTGDKPLNMYKISLSDKIIDLGALSDFSENDDTPKKFISCNYENCGTLVVEPELLIGDLYCSLACKNKNQTIIEVENFIDEQLLKTSCSEENDNCNELLIYFSKETSKKENQSSLKSLLPISSPEAIDDDDNNYFDPKPLIEDKDVLQYMTAFQLRSAPKKLFDKPFPTEKNLFVVGQKLEGIDPTFESLFCVMTVTEVCGYRIKLHFDGYEDEYDFWVNADCPDLFHPGWCEMNSRILQPPYNYGNAFDWNYYLRECQALPAPKLNFFTSNLNSRKNSHKFHIGGKLEALDKLTRTKKKQLIYVATVADILGNRVRIHFDGSPDYYDYWTDITSTYIHPVGWCEENGQTLLPPDGYSKDDSEAKKGKNRFSWTEYLINTNSKPVPGEAFVRSPIRDFSNHMIIEVVDILVPKLLRIAEVINVRGDELQILYDGFDSEYAYWVENDSPDIHPVGWSSKTNHPIERPPAMNTRWSCNIRGCTGHGNSLNRLKINHYEIKDCPYEINAWNKAIERMSNVPHRLETNNVVITTTLTSSKIKSNVHQDDEHKEKTRINTEHMNLAIMKEKINEKRLNVLLGANNIEPENNTVIRNTIFNDTIPSILFFNTTDARKWSIQEVASYVQKVVDSNNLNGITNLGTSIYNRFIDQEIDGEAFLMLNQDEIIEQLKIPLGPALKIANAIIMLEQQVKEID